MILDEVVFENFGAYGGRQAITLTPKSKKRRVTVVGALNGRGKTTMLDGIQLALYGNRAKLSNRGSLAYETYLGRARHRGAAPGEPFAVELAFSVNDAQGKVSYRVRRSFKATEGGAKEILEVQRDGQRDRALTETWAEHIEELLPLEISGLFFFDGEKVAELAEADQASQVISAAVTGLLGLGVIERLQRDLLVVERRKQDEVLPGAASADLAALELAVGQAEEAARQAARRCAEERTNVDRLTQQAAEAEAIARREGGELFERRADLERNRSAAQGEVAMADVGLRELAAGTLPFALCGELLRSLAESKAGAAGLSGDELGELLEVRDHEVVGVLSTKLANDSLVVVREVLDRDRQHRVREAASDAYRPPVSSVRAAASAVEQLAVDLSATVVVAQDRAASVDLAGDYERQLAGVPTEESIAEVLERREHLRDQLATARGRLDLLVEESERAERELEQRRAEHEKVRQELAMTRVRGQDAERILEHSAKVRTTLDLLKGEVRARSIAAIEAEVVKCFKKLLGKQNFVTRLELDVDTCEPLLTNKQGDRLHMERLSAGERQLFAVSMLWGLAIVSGRQLPTIIDTPLGRLDSIHRGTLVERYFPKAAEQVILLSTDEEIDRDLAEQMEDVVGRWYLIDYDDDEGRSTVSEGYLFEGVGHVA